jgi:hypothetical protein
MLYAHHRSVIDAYVLIMMMVAFNLDLNLFEQDVVVVRVSGLRVYSLQTVY